MAGTSSGSMASNKGAMTRASNNIKAIATAIGPGAEAGLAVAGKLLVTRIQMLISKPYPPASNPGNPPARRTGNLRSGYKAKVVKGQLSLAVQNDTADYWKFLEFGTSKMRPRPHVRPSMRAVRDELPKIIAKSIEAKQRAVARRLTA